MDMNRAEWTNEFRILGLRGEENARDIGKRTTVNANRRRNEEE